MPRLQTYLECVARAICETGGLRLAGTTVQGNSLLAVVRGAHQQISLRLSEADLRTALREAVAAPLETVELALSDAIASVAGDRTEDERALLTGFLELIPPIIRQALRRPGDPSGTSVPEQLPIAKLDDWLLFFPDRAARYKQGDTLEAFDNWQTTDLRGFGPYSETWRGWAENHPENATVSLKFITDPEIAEQFSQHEDLFRQILDLESMPGLVQLRSVYLNGDPPCLESAFVSGYDATGLIRDWQWRYDRPKPDQASLVVKRVARIVGHLHQADPPIAHRGLKPSNILMHPTADGKVSIWVSDLGWGEVSSAYAIGGTEPAQARRQARRGALTSLYASPEQRKGRPADPRDDVYALGVIWYQLLKRDPTASAPEGFEWALEFRKHGLSDGHARLLASCVDENVDRRPANGLVLASQIDANFTKPPEHGSQTFRLTGSSATLKAITPEEIKQRTVAKLPIIADLPKSFENSIGMHFVLVEPGQFMMGSPPEEKGHHAWEGPLHSVALTRPFYLGVFPVTQMQFQQIMKRNPSHFTPTHKCGPDNPVEQVDWQDAVTFCEKLTALPAENTACRLYRLPSEAEWEYACRAGTTAPYSFGETVSLKEVHYFGLNASTWAKVASTAGKTEKVGSHTANAWGFFDMHGNVLEWCNDWWGESYYAESADSDPLGPLHGDERVVRGGSFSQFAVDCRSAARLGRAPSSKLNTIGFRVAMSIPGT